MCVNYLCKINIQRIKKIHLCFPKLRDISWNFEKSDFKHLHEFGKSFQDLPALGGVSHLEQF